MVLTTLYKKDKKSKLQKWSVEVEGNKFRTSEGYVDGAITTTEWTECKGKRIGASNETTPEQQAQKEAEAKIKKQIDNKGWFKNIDDITARKVQPMLAHKFEDHREYAIGKEGVASQPKLDGIRCIASRYGLFTRNGKPIVAAPHVYETLLEVLDALPAGSYLDGELYNHDLKEDFNKITSLVRKQNPTAEELEESKRLLQYHVYDFAIADRSFAFRHAALTTLLESGVNKKIIHLVDTVFLPVAGNTNLLDRFYGEYREAGYEGQMIRIPASHYQHCRTKDLLKRKEFQDAEFTIVDIEEGRGDRSGMMGRIKFEGFDANARGTHEYFRELLANKEEYIGRKATVRYQNLTPDGIPRFPVVISIRNYE